MVYDKMQSSICVQCGRHGLKLLTAFSRVDLTHSKPPEQRKEKPVFGFLYDVPVQCNINVTDGCSNKAMPDTLNELIILY